MIVKPINQILASNRDRRAWAREPDFHRLAKELRKVLDKQQGAHTMPSSGKQQGVS